MASILVTGAGGLIGRRVVCAANRAGHRIAALVRKPCPGAVCSVIQHDLTLPFGNLPPVDWVFHSQEHMRRGWRRTATAVWKMAHDIIDWGLRAGK